MKKLKIAQVCPAFFPFVGGIEKATLETAKILVKKGHKVTIYTSLLNKKLYKGELCQEEEIEGIRVKRFPNFLGILGTWLPKIDQDTDIIHLRNYNIWPHSFLISKYYHKKPIFCTFHGGFSRFESNFPFSLNDLTSFFKFFWQYLFGIPNLNKLTNLIALHEWEKQNLIKKGASSEKIAVIPNGIEKQAFKKYYAPPKEKTPYLLALCRISPVKSLDHVIRILPRFSNLNFLIAGEDTGEGEKKRLQELCRQLKVEKRVRFLGVISGEEKYSFISGSMAVVVPSQWEMLSHTILETMAQGKVVIASNSFGNPYIVDNEINGLLYPFGNIEELSLKVKNIINNPSYSKKLGIKARKKIKENYQWEKVVEKIENLYLKAYVTK